MEIKFVSLVVAFFLSIFNIIGQTSYQSNLPLAEPGAMLNLSEARERIKIIDLPFEVQCTPVVESYLKTYFLKNRDKAAKIIGRAVMYFPLFEEVLAEKGMPDALKYLAVTESALHPKAISRVGAGGLWQFMPATGRHYGLSVSSKVDDRFDPEKSTRAASEYLQKYHRKYGDWALAIASYNSGPGRVSRAIKRSRSKNFWKLKRYLPRETRSYVPGFIAAAYLMKHHQEHGIQPQYPSLDMQLTESTMVVSNLSFYTIARVTGIALDVIRGLNPAYKEDEIPQSFRGYKLILPRRVMIAMKEFLERVQYENFDTQSLEGIPVYSSHSDNDQKHYYSSTYITAEGDNLYSLGRTFNCSPYSLMAWNNISSPYLAPGQEIKLFQYINQTRFNTTREPIHIDPVPRKPTGKLEISKVVDFSFSEEDEIHFLYQIKRGESLLDVANRFPGNSLSGLMKENNLSLENPPTAGMKIRIKK